ncbi:hypothetical protein EXIGLDRAFT_606911 [Exidia glandulosa HHB12029]|uniref:Uncharacterized protein n=1 Tax=Exidia glandulosa HHB12029 TaxID=1314781 RepID=A0A165LXH2_EXIGL|nr:hypothetical protein EXIGLDRAFT_606911 [Exidia glandulosa HHB12029]
MFDLIRIQLQRSDSLHEEARQNPEVSLPTNPGRKLITGIINSFTAKSEIGGPMAASYLLDLPDHYKSHAFQTVYWRSFVTEAMSAFQLGEPTLGTVSNTDGPVDRSTSTQDKVIIARRQLQWVALSPVKDYIYRPLEHENYCLYDWIRLATKSKRKPSNKEHKIETTIPAAFKLDRNSSVQDESFHKFTEAHPQHGTHTVRLENGRIDTVPNFVGGTLPRRDRGDRDYYCATMLTLFKPWRTGLDLKSLDSTWDEAYETYQFTARQESIMDNFNLRYECLDARDDFSKQRKAEEEHKHM